MAEDFFGYNRSVGENNQIATSEALTLSGADLGGSDLLQSVALQYGQQLQPMFAVGNSNIYFVGGQAQGTLDFERMTQCGKMFAGLGADCGKMGTVTLGGSGEGCFCGPGSVTISATFLESVRLNARAGQIPIMEGGRIRFGTLSKG